ncbi:MAG TPA: hypothetical protein VMW02_01670 [Thermoplasmata archaeon]|nr:hypothetical protein [Thermoplasmata archaeon]
MHPQGSRSACSITALAAAIETVLAPLRAHNRAIGHNVMRHIGCNGRHFVTVL